MAPTPDQLSSPGSVSYDSDTMVVGDGTWDFTKNTFLLPPLEGTDFDTMRYNGMGNRFSTVHQYHTIILAHGIMAAMVFLFLIPFSVMLARFYTREPAHAIRYHARLHVFSGLLLTAAFILPFFAVGPKRSLSNPHHGIGIAIYVMFVVQLFAGRLIQHIMKSRSLRVTLHKWLGRATALLGIVQVPLGLTLYGSPKVLFILYAVWMGFLLAVYFVLNYRAEGHHERYIPAGRSEAGTRITESEYYSDHREHEHEHSNLKWLGPLAAGAGIFALMRGRKKDHDDDRSRARTRSPSMSRTSITRSRGPTVISSRPSYFSEKYSDLPAQRSGGGGLFKALGGAAAAFGAGKVFSNFMDRRNQRDEEYSAVSTDLPHRNRSVRAATVSEFNSEYTDDVSTIPPSRAPAPTQTTSAYGGPRSPRRSNVRSNISRGDMMDESEYSSYVSPSRRPHDEPSGGGGFAKGVLGALGVGWFAKKFADRRARKEEEDRLREEEEMRSGTQFSRYSNNEYQSPIRRDSHRPPQRRSTVTGTEYSEMTESSFDTQTELSTMPPKGPRNTAAGVRPSTSALISDETSPPRRGERLSMPSMPSDPHGVLHRAGSESDITSLADRPQGRHPSRRQMDSERAAAEAAARASSLAAREQRRGGSSQTSGPARPRDDKEQVRLRKVTEEETLAQTSRGRRNSQSSLSALESPTKNRRYRRDDSKRRAESAAESRVESSRVGSSSRVQDEASRLGPLNPPGPSLSNPKRRGRDSGYNSGQPPAQQSGQPSQSGPSFLQPPGQGLPNASITSAGSHGTWSGMESDVSTEVPTAPRNPPQSTQRYPPQSTPHQPPPADDKGNESAADNRRRRRAERRRASGSRPSGTENTYDTSTYDENDGF